MNATPIQDAVRTKNTERTLYMQGFFISMYEFILIGFVLQSFLLMIGFEEMQLGLYGAAVQLGLIFTVLGAHGSSRYSSKKRFYIRHYVITVLAFSLFIVLPYMVQGIWLIGLAIVTLFIVHASANYAWSVLLPFMHDAIASERWDRFYSNRLAIMSISGFTALIWGFVLEGRGLSAYSLVFLFALCNLIVMLFLMGMVPEQMSVGVRQSSENDKPERISILALLKVNKNYRFIVLYNVLLSFAMGLYFPLRYRYLLDYLHIGLARLSIFEFSGIGVTILSLFMWGRLASKKNYLFLIVLLGGLKCLEPFLWILAARHPAFLVPIYVLFGAYESSGVIGSGLWMISLNYVLSISDMRCKTMMHNYNFMFKGISFIVASLLGGFLASIWIGQSISFAFLDNHLHRIMAMAWVLSIASAAFFAIVYHNGLKEGESNHGEDITNGCD